MCNVPKDCANCIFDTRCDSAMNMGDCRYCGLLKEEKASMLNRIKNYFGKFFK